MGVENENESFKNILFHWQKKVKSQMSFVLSPLDTEAVKYFSGVAAGMALVPSCHFKIINYDKVADALMKLKVVNMPGICNGEKVIGIREWGNIMLFHKNGEAFCERTNRDAEITVDTLTASRFLFGPFAPDTVLEGDEFLKSILPLPLGWSALDRV